MAPILETRILFFFACYVALKIVFLTFVGPHRSSLRDVPGPNPQSAWWGSLAEAFDAGPGVAFSRWTKQYGGAVRFRTVFGSDALVISDPAALHHILVSRSYDFIKPIGNVAAISDIGGMGLISVEGDSHRRQKKLMLPAFSPNALKELSPILLDKAKLLRDSWVHLVENSVVEEEAYPTGEQAQRARLSMPDKEAIVELNAWFNKYTMDIIGLAGFGYTFDTLRSNSTTLSDSWECMSTRVAAKPTPPAFVLSRLLKALARAGRKIDLERYIPSTRIQVDRKLRLALQEESQRIIEAKIKEVEAEGKESMEGSKDLIAILLRANWGEEKQPLTTEELRGQMMTILLAGHETTSNALTSALHLFALYPDVQAELREELSAAHKSAEEGGVELDYQDIDKLEYLDAVVHELLRVEPSVSVTTREPIVPTVLPLSRPIPSATKPGETLSHIPLKKGQQLMLSIYAANRSTELYGVDAEEFRPERWLERDEKGEKKIKAGQAGLYGLTTFLNGCVSFLSLLSIFPSRSPAFARSARGCIGYKFAIMEIKAALATLLPTFTFALRAPDMKVERRAEIVTRTLIEGEQQMGPRMVLRIGFAQ
ncbi:hypothetical protein JCM8097_002288 [Rhodosporidiobolus ruineniae]